MLRSFVEAAEEAMWCIEFLDPVRLDCSEYEVVRQVFDNESRWAFCNPAFKKLYDIPAEIDVMRQPVALYFSRNPENEEFVRRLIATGFSIDSVASVDTRHDGSIAHMENRVRGDLDGDRLLRLWGTVRDVTRDRQCQRALMEKWRDVEVILSSLPDAIFVTDGRSRLIAASQSAESMFGMSAESWLGLEIYPMLGLATPDEFLVRVTRRRWPADVLCGDGQRLNCDVHLAPLEGGAPERLVLSLRPALASLPLRAARRVRRPEVEATS